MSYPCLGLVGFPTSSPNAQPISRKPRVGHRRTRDDHANETLRARNFPIGPHGRHYFQTGPYPLIGVRTSFYAPRHHGNLSRYTVDVQYLEPNSRKTRLV